MLCPASSRPPPPHTHILVNKVCKRTGAVVEVIPSDESGELDLAALEEMLSRGGVKVVAVTHVPTNGGVINPAREGADGNACFIL